MEMGIEEDAQKSEGICDPNTLYTWMKLSEKIERETGRVGVSCLCESMPDRNNLREKGFFGFIVSEGSVHHGGQALWSFWAHANGMQQIRFWYNLQSTLSSVYFLCWPKFWNCLQASQVTPSDGNQAFKPWAHGRHFADKLPQGNSLSAFQLTIHICFS